MLKNNKRSLQVTAIAITVTLLLVGASGHVAAKAKKITINHKKMTLAIGQKRALKVKNTKKKVKWISKNKKVAIVNKKGIVTAKKKGSAKIVAHICNMLDEIKPSRMVLAHMGGWGCWDQVMDRIIGRDVYLDTAFSTTSAPREGAPLSTDLFTVMIQKHGADRIVMGSDSPWSDQLDSINAIKNCNIPEESIAKILGDNAKKLLQL